MQAFSQFDTVVVAWIILALALVPIQLDVTAPYGRHIREGWGPTIPARRGWMLMECGAIVIFGGLFLIGPVPKTAPMWVFFAAWIGHYIHRTLVYPMRARMRDHHMPVVIVASGAFFQLGNAGLNGLFLGWLTEPYPTDWLFDPRFIIGAALFLLGAAINICADTCLIALRKGNAPDYSVPRGRLFEYVSCPNHFGEIVEWTGFAIMCWNLPALSFAIWTAANLIPRALSHHRWYHERFPDYPVNRRAVIPYVL